MKALTTNGLTKLIQLIKSSFISNTDTVTTNTVTLATVATSGSYNDLSNKPTIPTVGNGTITFTQGGVTKGTITTNQTGNSTIALDAGGTVDQTYDGTSTNAQSGVAIAGELTNYVLSSSSNSIDINSGTSISLSAPETTDITANGLPIITSYNILSNDAYLTIGEYLNNYGIYLYDSDYIKFFYAEDGAAGLSAYSSNRQSHYAIDLLPSGISFGNENYRTTITVPSNGSLALNGSEIITGDNTRFDGQFVYSYLQIANGAAVPTTTNTDYDLSSYLPNDGYDYEVLFSMAGFSASTAHSDIILRIGTPALGTDVVNMGRNKSDNTTQNTSTSGTVMLPVPASDKKVTVPYITNNTGNYYLFALGYRRIGTNS